MATLKVSAKTIVDLYGLSLADSAKIIKKYGKEVGDIETQRIQQAQKIALGIKDNKQVIILKKREILIEKIKQEQGFLFVSVQTVFYPDDPNLYTTIEIIAPSEPERLNFVSAKVDPTLLTKGASTDLIEEMRHYEQLASELLMTNQIDPREPCPVYHCTLGFSHPKLQPYLAIFNEGSSKERTLILQVLNEDPNPERRAAAAFLLGHFKNPQELISLLLPYVMDRDKEVRNNVIRVIAATMQKAKVKNIVLRPFLALLHSPYVSDRNKALYVIWLALEFNPEAGAILQQEGNNLLSLLALKQPNNHDLAYLILKKLSANDFGEQNIASWKAWLRQQEKQNI